MPSYKIEFINQIKITTKVLRARNNTKYNILLKIILINYNIKMNINVYTKVNMKN